MLMELKKKWKDIFNNYWRVKYGIRNFIRTLKNLGKRVATLKESISTEEATKTSLIMPFFQILGYDIFNPLEFIPEFTADFGIKKGEKVDYAIKLNDEPVILIEAKSISEKLTKHDSQLFRYFGTTTSKFGILTNGQEYKFYTDLDEPNKMDNTPFLTIDITKIKDIQIVEIAKFHKENFDIDKITSSAAELKHLNNLKAFLSEQLSQPTDSFLKYIVGEIYEGPKTKNTLEKFEPIVKKGFSQFISERVNEKLSAALNTNVDTKLSNDEIVEEIEEASKADSEIVTTPEELEAYTTTKIVLKDIIDPSRVFYRDNRSYFNILIDDNIRKWIMRVYVSNHQIKLVFNNEARTTVEIKNPLDIVQYSAELEEVTKKFIPTKD